MHVFSKLRANYEQMQTASKCCSSYEEMWSNFAQMPENNQANPRKWRAEVKRWDKILTISTYEILSSLPLNLFPSNKLNITFLPIPLFKYPYSVKYKWFSWWLLIAEFISEMLSHKFPLCVQRKKKHENKMENGTHETCS